MKACEFCLLVRHIASCAVVPIQGMSTLQPSSSHRSSIISSSAGRLISGVYAEVRLDFPDDFGLVPRVEAMVRKSAEGVAFELSWSSLAGHMLTGLAVAKNGETLWLSPDDIYEVDGMGWGLLMRHGIVPTVWVD